MFQGCAAMPFDHSLQAAGSRLKRAWPINGHSPLTNVSGPRLRTVAFVGGMATSLTTDLTPFLVLESAKVKPP